MTVRLHENDLNTREHWDRVWEKEMGPLVPGASVVTDRLDEMAAKIVRGDRVLDVGGGRGEIALYVRNKAGCHVTVAELSTYAVGECRKRLVPAFQCDWRELDEKIPPGDYDVVLCGELLEHADDPKALVAKLVRACRRGGWVTLTTPITGRWDHELTHLWRFAPEDVFNLLEPHGRTSLVYLNNGENHATMLVAHCEVGRRSPCASEIPGWMYENDLKWLASAAKGKNVIVEVGSYQGRSTRALGENVAGKVYAVDDWDESHNAADVPLLCVRDGDAGRTLFEKFSANLADLIDSGKVVPIMADHANVPELPELADMVLIDGSHYYKDAKRDVLTWLPRLRSGGLLCGHDSHIPDVMRAVSECLVVGEIFTVPDYIWFWKKP